MKCPMCGNRVRKARLDVYWCQDCRRAWLIHRLSTYKSFEEASETNHEAQLKQDFLAPITVPPKPRG